MEARKMCTSCCSRSTVSLWPVLPITWGCGNWELESFVSVRCPAMQMGKYQEGLNPTAIVGVPSMLLKFVEFAQELDIDLNSSSVKKAICIGENIRNADFFWIIRQGKFNKHGTSLLFYFMHSPKCKPLLRNAKVREDIFSRFNLRGADKKWNLLKKAKKVKWQSLHSAEGMPLILLPYRWYLYSTFFALVLADETACVYLLY